MSNDVVRLFGAASHGLSPVALLALLFGLSLVPLLAVATTSFTRIVVVLGLLRASLGTQSLPPNAVLMALAMLMSAVIMAPTFERVRSNAVDPFLSHRVSTSEALQRGGSELRAFMLRQTRSSDIAVFARLTRGSWPSRARLADCSFSTITAAFMVGELRTAFAMGFAFALPFAVIDLVVAAVMMSLGMFMVSPSSVALPLKLLLFVAADGWSTVCGTLLASFR